MLNLTYRRELLFIKNNKHHSERQNAPVAQKPQAL
jgi:hypothetical protein